MLTIHEVADRYGVRLLEVDSIETFRQNQVGVRGGQRACDPGFIGCPTDVAAALFNRRAVVCRREEYRDRQEAVLHEIMHLVLTPQKRWTGRPRNQALLELDEAFILLQVEREVARLMGEGVYEKVLSWQHDTGTSLLDVCEILLAHTEYEDDDVWLGGYALARRVGVLDARNHPTWCWPCWDRRVGRAAAVAMSKDRSQLLKVLTDSFA